MSLRGATTVALPHQGLGTISIGKNGHKIEAIIYEEKNTA